MSLPAGVTTFTLTFGPLTDAEGLAALVAKGGKLYAVDPSTNRKINLTHVATGQVIVPAPVDIVIASDGTGSVGPIPHTGQAGLSPTGYAWRVQWNTPSNTPSPGNLTFVVPSGTTVKYADLQPAATLPVVAISLPPVTSVAGLTGAPTAQQVADALDVPLRAAFGALQKVAATVTSSGALVVTKHNPVDASGGAKTMTLPTGQAEGTQVSVEKTDSSVNAVSITGNIRGVAAQTITLPWQNEALLLRADSAGSWWPISGHKTKGSLDATYIGISSSVYARSVAGSPPPPPPLLTPIDTFQAGHSWTLTNTDTGSSTARTTDPVLGSQYVRMITTGAGAGTPARMTRSGLSPTLNMTGKKFAILARVTNTQNLEAVFLYAGSSGFAAYNLFQADRYEDDRVKSWFREGEWAWMVIGHEMINVVSGTPPRGAYVDLRVAIADKGTGGKVTFDIAAIASVPEPTGFGSTGLISFSCDDNWRSQFTTARPYLDKYLYPATAYTIADAIGTSALGREGSMTLAELQQLQNANRWEVGAHAYSLAHHNLTGGFTDLTAAELDAENASLKAWLKDNGFRGFEHLAYPQGAYNPTVVDRMRAWYTSARALNGFANDTFPPNSAHRIRSLVLSSGITLAAVKARVDKAVAGKGWLVIVVHRVEAGVSDSLTWTEADFSALVDYVAASGATVRTVGDVLASR